MVIHAVFVQSSLGFEKNILLFSSRVPSRTMYSSGSLFEFFSTQKNLKYKN
jgi:hypothetical protein